MGKFTSKLQKFMYGRYGTDQLNTLILGAGVVVSLVSAFVRYLPVRLPLMAVSYGLLIWAVCRTFSRKTWKRFEENQKYLAILRRLRDRDHRYYRCPKCRQQVRVPKKKGKISITCPKCKEKFIKKT